VLSDGVLSDESESIRQTTQASRNSKPGVEEISMARVSAAGRGVINVHG
jgi:hypothetical protein